MMLLILAKTASRPEWIFIESFDVPLQSHTISHVVDNASLLLLDGCTKICSRALAPSTARGLAL